MQIGEQKVFGFRSRSKRYIVHAPGQVIENTSMTADGLQVIRVQFDDDKIRNYSLAHFNEAQLRNSEEMKGWASRYS